MDKKTFIDAIKAIENQLKYDHNVSKKLSKVFTECYAANLLYNNYTLIKAFIKVLEIEMNDTQKCIEHFCFELKFGKENNRLKVYDNSGKEIPLSNASQLYNFLNVNK